MSWFRGAFPGVLIYAVPNGGSRNIVEAAKLKAEGVVSGIPDLHVPEWNLWIEMKKQKDWKVSENQNTIKKYLESIGHDVLICKGAMDAYTQIMEWRDKNVERVNKFTR